MADQAMLKSILKWSLKQGEGRATTTAEGEVVTEMSEERREWLRGALDQYVMDETRRINEIVELLEYKRDHDAGTRGESDTSTSPSSKTSSAVDQTNATSTKTSEGDAKPTLRERAADASEKELLSMREKGLEELVDRLCQIDNAKYFALNHGGSGKMKLLLDLMSERCPHTSLRWRAADVFATVVQNNTEPQAKALDLGVVDFLLNRIKAETDDKVVTKLFFALSCLVRGEHAVRSLRAFVDNDGVALLGYLIQRESSGDRLLKKVLFFLMWLFQSDPKGSMLNAFVGKSEVVRRIVRLASQDDDIDMSEKALKILQMFAESDTGCKALAPKDVANSVGSLLARLRDAYKGAKGDAAEMIRERLKLTVAVVIGMKRRGVEVGV
eukprot:g1167.t1